MTLRIEIDREKCMGSGNCSFWAPGTFDLDDEGIAVVKDTAGDPDGGDSPERDTEDKVVLAGQGCPTQAIAIWRDDERIV